MHILLLYVQYNILQCMHSYSIKTHGSESRGQEEAACMHVF